MKPTKRRVCIVIQVKNRQTYSDSGVLIGRGSPLGNPFSHLSNSKAKFKVASREEAVEKYRDWLEEQLKTPSSLVSKTFLNLVEFYRDFGELTLICWCKPLACHGDIIKEMIEERIACPTLQQ